jgi:hypothetical protein
VFDKDGFHDDTHAIVQFTNTLYSAETFRPFILDSSLILCKYRIIKSCMVRMAKNFRQLEEYKATQKRDFIPRALAKERRINLSNSG